MDDLKRMEQFYDARKKDSWSLFHCYPFFLDSAQTEILTTILKETDLEKTTLLDIGAGEGNFLLKLMILGLSPQNITAVEYLEPRFQSLTQKLPHITSYQGDFLKLELTTKYTLITLMAVLTSITDNTLRYQLFSKALETLDEGGSLILYDYFDDREPLLSENYRALSLKKVLAYTDGMQVHLLKNVYLKSAYAKGLCKLGLKNLIPFVQSLKIFNAPYPFIVIQK